MKKEDKMKTVLTIAGSDCSGGAGIQADIKTLTVHGVYAMSCITALTAQNTLGITGIMPVPEDFFRKQLESIFTDIRPDVVKTGMICSAEQAEWIVEYVKKYGVEQLVVDPVMISSSGTSLMKQKDRKKIWESLFSQASVLTPNIPEAEILSQRKITSKYQREEAAREIGNRWKCAVFCKGGHDREEADDLLFDEKSEQKMTWFRAKRIDNPNTHGTGCTLSSAIAANLALGFSIEDSVQKAKAYVNQAIRAGLDLGKGNGPLNHMGKESEK